MVLIGKMRNTAFSFISEKEKCLNDAAPTDNTGKTSGCFGSSDLTSVGTDLNLLINFPGWSAGILYEIGQ